MAILGTVVFYMLLARRVERAEREWRRQATLGRIGLRVAADR